MRKPLTRSELEAFHSVLRRACERMEQRKRRGEVVPDSEVEQLAAAVADLDDELARAG